MNNLIKGRKYKCEHLCTSCILTLRTKGKEKLNFSASNIAECKTPNTDIPLWKLSAGTHYIYFIALQLSSSISYFTKAKWDSIEGWDRMSGKRRSSSLPAEGSDCLFAFAENVDGRLTLLQNSKCYSNSCMSYRQKYDRDTQTCQLSCCKRERERWMQKSKRCCSPTSSVVDLTKGKHYT